jgi:sterol desaturase/sphingolipid hydroxylase (fatty acid hydroxylase superfamily)
VWFSEGLIALDCFDFWIGTMCFFLSAMVVMLLFAWKLNIKRGIADLNKNSQIRIPKIYIWCMKYLTPTALVALFLGWLVQNIWSQQAPPLKALLELKTGAVVPVITILAYFVFLQFITVASNRHKKRAKRAKRLKKGISE